MGLWDKIFGELIDVIEWTDDTDDTMVYRFDRYGNEIKYGAMLTVRESQLAILVNKGKLRMYSNPGSTSWKPVICRYSQPYRHGNMVLKARLRPRFISLIPGGLPT
jgi:SPFH domain-Band 7 family